MSTARPGPLADHLGQGDREEAGRSDIERDVPAFDEGDKIRTDRGRSSERLGQREGQPGRTKRFSHLDYYCFAGGMDVHRAR